MVITNESRHAQVRKLGRLALDMVFVVVAIAGAMVLRFFPSIPFGQVERMLRCLVWILLVYAAAFLLSGTYRILWTYASIRDTLHITMPLLGAVSATLLMNAAMQWGVSQMVLILIGILSICFCCGTRLLWCIRGDRTAPKKTKVIENIRPVLIVGAGDGANYAIQLCHRSGLGKPVAMVDDDPYKQNLRIHNIPVRGYLSDLPRLLAQYKVQEVIIAILALKGEKLDEVVSAANAAKCHVRIISYMNYDSDIVGKEKIGLRKLNISDFLSRAEVRIDAEKVSAYLRDQTVLVTGGGGSIGSELCRQIMCFSPRHLLIFDIYENKAYELLCALRQQYGPDCPVTVLIGSIQDKARVDEIMRTYQPQVVFHAAAHKHVPLMESSPAEAVKNNVFGTRTVLESACEHGVGCFVTLSTDKAVNPANVMGATKRITEMLIQYYARVSSMKCMAVRFGNVLGSQGSVIPLFEAQIQRGGPVLVTHQDIERFFMTIPEAAQLVLQAGSQTQNGAVYMLDMGKPVRIMDLAEKIIRSYGYTPNVDMEIRVSGLRPGEKIYEELLTKAEASALKRTEHEKVMIASPLPPQWAKFPSQLDMLISLAERNDPAMMDMLTEIVPSFTPQQLKMIS